MTRLRCTFPRVLLPTARRHYSVMPPDGAVGAHGREGRRNGAPESGERETLKSQNNDAEAHPAGLPALSAGNTSASRRTTLLGEPGPGRGHGVPRFRLAPEYGDHLGQSILSAAADLKDGNEEAGYEEATPPPVRQLLLNPRIIRGHLDTHVVGQERLKRTMATAVYNHYVRIESNMPKPEYEPTLEADFRTYTKIPRKPSFSHPINRVVRHDERDKVVLEKSNILLLGPTGSGKTLIAKTTADLLQVPFSINDATPFTQAGYVGQDVEECIARLLQAADYDVSRAQRGIVFIDEIDKLAKRADGGSVNQRDVSGEGVQQGLLRMLEGTIINVNVKGSALKRGPMTSSNGEVFPVDTTNILFVLSGAFVGLDRIVAERVGKKGSIGFGAEVVGQDKREAIEENVLDHVEPDDLVKYGLIPEFVGRLPIVANARMLTVDELAKILTEPKNAIVKQYSEIFERNGIDLRFNEGALKEIAEEARKRKTGARGLRRLMEQILADTMYEQFGSDARVVIVDEEAVRTRSPKVFKANQEGEAEKVFGAPIFAHKPRASAEHYSPVGTGGLSAAYGSP